MSYSPSAAWQRIKSKYQQLTSDEPTLLGRIGILVGFALGEVLTLALVAIVGAIRLLVNWPQAPLNFMSFGGSARNREAAHASLPTAELAVDAVVSRRRSLVQILADLRDLTRPALGRRSYSPKEIADALLKTPYAHYAFHLDPSTSERISPKPPLHFHAESCIVRLHEITPEAFAAVVRNMGEDKTLLHQMSLAIHQMMSYDQAVSFIDKAGLPRLDGFFKQWLDRNYRVDVHGTVADIHRSDQPHAPHDVIAITPKIESRLREVLPEVPYAVREYIAWMLASSVRKPTKEQTGVKASASSATDLRAAVLPREQGKRPAGSSIH